MAFYPNYPQPVVNISDIDLKYPLDNNMQLYDEMTSVGLYVIPKHIDGLTKKPLYPFWNKKDGKLVDVLHDRDRAEALQSRSDVSGWCVVAGELSDNLVVVDLDPAEIIRNGDSPREVYVRIQEMSPTRFVLATPANGVHLYYRTNQPAGNRAGKGVDVRGEGGYVVAQGGFNRYTDRAEHKGVEFNHTQTYRKLPHGRYDDIPQMSDELYAWLYNPRKDTVARAVAYQQSDIGRERLRAHMEQPVSERVKIVRECLSHILPKWENDSYDLWLQLWMSAHHGSDGDHHIRDMFLLHENIEWSDGEIGRQHFIDVWDKHEHREDGYTVSSLHYLARDAGWLTTTDYEIPDKLTEQIDVNHVTEWIDELDEIPKRCLLMSQTGSGKTYALKDLFYKLDSPKTVVFVPSIKLATELANTLKNKHGLPVTLYRDQETGKLLPANELAGAKILVTTLQTFAMKIGDTDMSQYGLVYVEESDQLLQQFARGDGGEYFSHVSGQQSRKGYQVIANLMRSAGVMWFVDATMSMVTYEVAMSLRGKRRVTVIRNTRISPKAPVTMVDTHGEAREAALAGLLAGKRVVVACDTASVAKEVYDTLDNLGVLDSRNSILLIKNTEHQPKVRAFMRDVNTEASMYDLVVYNSVMASGVSIEDFQPDLIVQIGGYLTPRMNLQILNRYRKQNAVVCYYRPGESLYAPTAELLQEEARLRAEHEAQMVNMPLLERTGLTSLRDWIRAISIADERQQRRAARQFYIGLLRSDGREVIASDLPQMTAAHLHTLKGVRQLKKALSQWLARTWYQTEPIDSDRPAKPEYSDEQVAQGKHHAHIEYVLGGVPDLNDHDPEYVSDVVNEFSGHTALLTSFMGQLAALDVAESHLADRGKALMSMSNHITTLRIVMLVFLLYDDINDVLTPEKLDERAPKFLDALVMFKDKYDAAISRTRNKFDNVYAREDNTIDRALAFAKILLAEIGLKQRSRRDRSGGGDVRLRYISNADMAQDMIRWRYGEDAVLPTNSSELDEVTKERQYRLDRFKSLSDDEQERVIKLVDGHTNMETAVEVVKANSDREF
jgi:hypothetical protein